MSLGWKWFIEYQTPHSAHMHGIKQIIYSGKSRFQSIDIVESCEYGRMLILDGKVQSTTKDEFFYHEVLVHPVMIAHPKPESILIIGGGEGGTLREVLKHPTAKYVVMVDIDLKVIESSKKYMPELSCGAFDDERADVVIGDGRRFVESCKTKFDVVAVDVTDPLEGGPAQLLYTEEFYSSIGKILSEDGIVVTQATSVYYSAHCFGTIYKTMESALGKAGGYQAWIPAYDSTWGFVYGTKGPDPKTLTEEDVEERLVKRGICDLRFYEGAVHRTLFVLSRELRGIMNSAQIATDSNPTFMPI